MNELDTVNTKYMTASIVLNTDLVLDMDELEGIIQQLEAISCGWGMDFSVSVMEEKVICEWRHDGS